MTPLTIECDQRHSLSPSQCGYLLLRWAPWLDGLAMTPASSGMTMAVNLLLFATPLLCESATTAALSPGFPPLTAPRA